MVRNLNKMPTGYLLVQSGPDHLYYKNLNTNNYHHPDLKFIK